MMKNRGMKSRLFILTLGTFAIGTNGFIIAGITSDIVQHLHVSYAAAGQLVTVFSLVVAIVAPILATITANMEPKKVLVWTLSVFTLGNSISALAPNFTWLMLSRVITALGAALYTPVSTTVATRVVPEGEQGRAISIVSSGLTVAITLGVPIGTWLGTLFGWRIAFGIVAAAGFIAILGIQFLFPVVGRAKAIQLKDRLSPVTQLPLLTFLVSGLGVTIGSFALHTYINPVLQAIGGFGDLGISMMLAIFGVSCVVGVGLGGYLTDKIGAIPTLITTIFVKFITLAGFAVLMMMNPSILTIILVTVAVILWGISSWALNPAIQQHLIKLAPQSPQVVLALNATFLYLGIGGGSAMGGLILKYSTMPNLGWASAAAQLVSLVLVFLSTRLVREKATGKVVNQ
jgi:predicted MFS family arabinose efflux permease